MVLWDLWKAIAVKIAIDDRAIADKTGGGYVRIGQQGSVQYHAAIHQGAIEHYGPKADEAALPYRAGPVDDAAMSQCASYAHSDGGTAQCMDDHIVLNVALILDDYP